MVIQRKTKLNNFDVHFSDLSIRVSSSIEKNINQINIFHVLALAESLLRDEQAKI